MILSAIKGGITFSEDHIVPPFKASTNNKIAAEIQQNEIICCMNSSNFGFLDAVAIIVKPKIETPQKTLVILSINSRFMFGGKSHIIQINW